MDPVVGSRDYRRGVVLIIVMVCFVLAATLFLLLGRWAVAERQAAQMQTWRLQAQWLAEGALERAAARLAADENFGGETWTIPAKELAGAGGGTVKIDVKKDADRPRRRVVSAEARYPDDPVHCCRSEKQIVVEVAERH